MAKFFFCLLISISQKCYSQEGKVFFTGTWRWVSENNDTLVLFIKPITYKETKDKRSVTVDFFGYHTYIKNGEIVESSMSSYTDTMITNATTISGNLHDGTLHFGLNDLTRNATLFLSLIPIHNDSKRAWLKYHSRDHGLHPNTSNRLFPSGKTIPTNIVLEKISDVY